MLLEINPSSPKPLFEQIAAAVRDQVATGTLRAGTRLPSARDLAEQLGVNLHTVLKAYQGLREEGLVEMRPGRGSVISKQARALPALTPHVDDLLERATAAGIELEALISLLRARSSPS